LIFQSPEPREKPFVHQRLTKFSRWSPIPVIQKQIFDLKNPPCRCLQLIIRIHLSLSLLLNTKNPAIAPEKKDTALLLFISIIKKSLLLDMKRSRSLVSFMEYEYNKSKDYLSELHDMLDRIWSEFKKR